MDGVIISQISLLFNSMDVNNRESEKYRLFRKSSIFPQLGEKTIPFFFEFVAISLLTSGTFYGII